MALLNYLFPGSYTVVTDMSYGKSAHILYVQLKIYKDNTKTTEIGKRSFQFERSWVPNLNGAFLTQPPSTINPGDGFLTAMTGCTGEWADRDHLYAVWNGNEWVFWTLGGRDIYYDVVRDRYVHLEHDYTLKDIDFFGDARTWDSWLDFTDPNMNALKQVYNFLKNNVPSFADCADG